MKTAFKLNEMIDIANSPLRSIIVESQYAQNSGNAVSFDAALKLLDKPGVNRNELHDVHTCNGTNQASIIGKFIFVEEF